MANSDKNIRITTSKNKTTYPNIVFTGSAAGSSVITLEVLDDNTLSFTSNEGQVFSIDSNLSTGTIWAVSDISGVPLLSSSAGGTVGLAVYGGIVGIGQTNPIYKLDLKGSFGLASSNDNLYNFIFSNSAASGSNSLQIRSANSLLLYNSGNTFYTGFKSNAATNVTYTLPTTDGSSGQFLQTNGTGTLTWATATGSGGTGSTAGVGQGGQYEMAYYPGTGLSVVGSNTFTNNTATGVVSIIHSTVSTDSSTGAFKVTGGVGIGGSLYVGGIGASITGVTFSNSTITRGTWNGTVISTTYGGTGLNLTGTSGILTVSSGTVSASTTSSAIASALSDETGSGSLVFNSQPSFGTGVTTGNATFAVFNTNATTINAFGAATAINIGAATGKATFNSTDDSSSTTTGSLAISGGAGIAKSVSIGGRLQMFNGANFTAFVSSASGNTVYTLPATSPATGSSVLSSTSTGVLSWVPLATASGSVNSGTANFAAYYATSSTAISENANLQFTGTGLSVGGNLSSSSTLTGSLIVRGGLGITGNAFIGGTVTIQDTTVSSSTTTGALVVAGGIGVGGKVFADVLQSGGNAAVGGNLTVAGTVDLGNAIADSISFLGRVDTSINPIADNTYDLGIPGFAYRNASFGGSVYFTNSSNTNIFALRAGATGSSLTYVFPIDTPTAGQVLAASAPSAGVVTLSWEDDQTGAPAGGITSLNGLGAASQSFATGTSGTDFAISSVTSTHTFNLPDASSSARGVISTGTQTIAGAKTFSSALSITASTVATNTSTGALVVTGGVGIGGSLYTATGSSSSVSGVILQNGNVSASTYNKLTVSPPTSNATLTIADGSSLITSGANSLTLTTTATTNATFPTGNITLVATNVASLASLTTASSLNSIGTITSGTWAGTVITSLYGGTGFNSYSVGDLLVASTGTSLAKLSAGSLNFVLTSNGPGTVPTWQAVPASSASSVATVSNNNDALFFPTFVSTATGSGQGLTTDSDFTYNPGKNQLTVTNITGTAATYALYTNQIQIGNNGNNINILNASGSVIANFNTSNGWFRSAQTTESSNTGTGSLVTLGGLGVAKNAFIGGTTVVTNATSSVSPTSGALSVTGGLGLAGNAFIGGTVNITSSAVSVGTNSGALVVTGGVGIGGSLYTGTSVASSISGVIHSNGAVTASTVNRLTLTAPASSATLTLANGSSLITSGGHSLTFTTTNTTSVTLPTTGTLATTSNKLSDFAATTSSELLNTITGETGSGALVFGTSPEFTTSITTPSTTFSVFNATATAINAFGAATTISIGANSGKATFNSADNSISTTTGAIVATGGAAVGQSLSIGGRLQMFNGANYTAFVSAASGNITYTLPPTAPSGTGTSYLSASTTGVMAWVAAPTSGGSATPGGTVDGSVQFKSGSSFGGTRGLLWDDLIKFLRVSGYPGGEPYVSSQAALLVEQAYGSFNGSGNGNIIGANALSAFTGSLIDLQLNAVTRFRVSSTGAVTFANAFTFPTTDGSANQVLQTNGSGTVSWATVSGSSGAGSGTVAIPGAQYQVAAYYWSATGASVSGSSTFTNNTATGVVDINHTTESTSTSTGALVVDGGAGIAKSLFVGTTLAVGGAPGYNIPNNLASFVSTVNSYNQLVIQNRSNGATASANLVVNNDVSTDSTFYGEIGMNSSAFSGSGALAVPSAVYVTSTSAPLVLGSTTQHPIRFVVNASATDTLFIDGAGTAISVFTNFDIRSQNKIRFFNSGNTFRTELHAGANTANYALSLPTAPVGAGASVIVTGSDGLQYFAAPGSGIAFSSATANTPVIRTRRSITMQFCAGYTPLAAGPDNVILKIPDSSHDGITDITYRLREFDVRVETPSSGSSRVQLERFSTTGALTYAATGTSMIAGLGVTLSGAGIYSTSVSTNSFAGTLVTSNNKLRVNWTLLNATHANFSIQLTMEEV
jgi:hypothetical protein